MAIFVRCIDNRHRVMRTNAGFDFDFMYGMPTEMMENEWISYHDGFANATLMSKTNSWYMGSNVPGKQRRRPQKSFATPSPTIQTSTRRTDTSQKGPKQNKDAVRACEVPTFNLLERRNCLIHRLSHLGRQRYSRHRESTTHLDALRSKAGDDRHISLRPERFDN